MIYCRRLQLKHLVQLSKVHRQKKQNNSIFERVTALGHKTLNDMIGAINRRPICIPT